MPFDRRHLLKSGAAAALVGLVGDGASRAAASPATGADAPAPGFTGVPATLADGIAIPPEYRFEVLYPWGSPTGIAAAMPAFASDGSNTAADQALQAGMHHDGMHFFALGADRGLLVMNHEYTDERLLQATGKPPESEEQVRKSLHAMGVSVIEIARTPQGWRQVLPSRYARRVHGYTPMRVAGPAAGTPLMRTALDPTGTQVLGTFANCAMGVTPWGTYLTCEENFQGYFGGPKKEGAAPPSIAKRRYGALPGAHWVDYWRFDERFDLTKHPNEANRFGWVVEIDPFDPQSTPVKRTALGRKRQESATCRITADGRLAVYMGDDAPFEYIYKFISRDKVVPGRDAAARRANRDLLDEGTLYVARYDSGGRGAWLELRHGLPGIDSAHGFADAADVLVHARLAGDAVGATKLDRPEWIAIEPRSGEAYAALTGNGLRGADGQPPADAANPRGPNLFGGILRWREDDGDAGSTGFSWDHFVLSGDSGLTESGARYPIGSRGAMADVFGNPDGLHFDSGGLLWIQTDMPSPGLGKGALAGLGNNAMLCANPATGDIRRFLVGPRGCEVSGCVVTPDRRTLFVNIQHPGEGRAAGEATPTSAWPDGSLPGDARPRSATVVVQRRDGGIVGT